MRPHDMIKKCPTCMGKKFVFCPGCDGTRLVDGKTCTKCKGTGRVKCEMCHEGRIHI
jgi:hypothetical protein